MVSKIFWFLFHTHKWVIVKETPFRIHDNGETISAGQRYTLQCSKCGNLKEKRII